MKAEVSRQHEEIPIADVLCPRVEKAMPTEHPDEIYVGLDDVEAHTTKLTGWKLSSSMKSSAKRFYPGDVLYSRLRPYLNKVWLADRPGLCSAEFIVLPSNEFIDGRFLKLRLNARDFVSFANSLNAGDRPRVDFEQISTFSLPPCSLARQRRIVAKIEELFSELDDGEASLRRARQQLGVYRQSLLKQAFEGNLTAPWRTQNPHLLESPDQRLTSLESRTKTAKETAGHEHPIASWSNRTLEELTEFVTSGSRGWAKYYSDTGSLFIRAQNLNRDFLNLNDVAFVSPPESAEGKRTRVAYGDILITITGANTTKTGWVNTELGDAYVSQHVALCRPVSSEFSEFVYRFIISAAGGRKKLEKDAYGAGKPGLNLQNVRSLVVPFPSLPEQAEIVRLLDEQFTVIEQNEREIDAALKRSEALRQSILKKAFSGQLVPQHPTDEPASALLDRIRTQRAATALAAVATKKKAKSAKKKAARKRIAKKR